MKVAWKNKSEVVLVVDDESGLRASCRQMLVAEGYTVLEADNGFEALILAAQRSGEVDLLLTEVALPGISGARLANAFEQLWPGVPVMYLADDATPSNSQIRPGAAIVAKRLLNHQLINRVDGVIEASRHSTIH